jgi:predicted metal-binding protein
MTVVLQVCAGCKDPDTDRPPSSSDGGPAMLAAITRFAEGYATSRAVALAVRDYPCLGNCSRRCRLSIAGAARWAWLLGDLSPRQDLAPLGAFLDAWLAAPDGSVATELRPTALRPKLIGRVAPI